MKILLFVLLLSGVSVSSWAQADASWDQLKHLPPHMRVHVAADKQSKVCVIDLVDDETLRCSKGASQYSFPRAEVKSVKRVRTGRSALVGVGIGLGVGAGVGAAIGHSKEKPNDFFPGLTTEAFTAIGAAVGLIAGGAIGGPTDFTRGPTLYRRP
jgi:hypothetical protein